MDVLFLTESDTAVAADLQRLADLMPGLVAEVFFSRLRVSTTVDEERSASYLRCALGHIHE